MAADEEATRNGGSRPVPDPTLLTTEQLLRSIAALRDYIDGQLAIRDERLSGIDTATELRLMLVPRISNEIDAKVGHLAELTTERFTSAERLRVEQKKDTKDAVDAALSAAKEAVKEQTTASGLSISKSEAATAAQLKQQQETFTTSIEGLRRSIDELKDRETEDIRNLRQSISEVATTANGTVQRSGGAVENRTSLYATITIIVAVMVGVVVVAGFIIARLPAPA